MTDLVVASFFAPRPPQPGVAWSGTDYDALCRLLDASCARFGLEHVVITDQARPAPLKSAVFDLPANLMLALIDGQRQFLAATPGPVLLVGADCVITRDPRPMLIGDMTITIGPFGDCEMNSGAIWCASGQACARVWEDALARRPLDWGDDQRALYAAMNAAHECGALNITKVRCEDHNFAPDNPKDDAGMPTVVHFRGERKKWMADWCRRYLQLEVK